MCSAILWSIFIESFKFNLKIDYLLNYEQFFLNMQANVRNYEIALAVLRTILWVLVFLICARSHSIPKINVANINRTPNTIWKDNKFVKLI